MEITAKLSTDLPTITAEINAYQRVAGEAIFEIGKRLKGVRDNPEEYGFTNYRDWERWCEESLGMKRSHANRFIKVHERFVLESPGIPIIPKLTVAYLLTAFTDEELEESHEMPDGSTKKLTEMSRREIEDIKAELRREEKARKEAESQRDTARRSESIAISRADRAESENVALRDTLESMADADEVDEPLRKIDEESRRRFYDEFITELEYIRAKYGAIALEGAKLRESVEYDEDKCRKIDDFDDFWQSFGKSAFKHQTIIEMGNV